MSLSKVAERLCELGLNASADTESLKINWEDVDVEVRVPDEWVTAIKGYYRARQYNFDESRRMLKANRFVEFQVTKLAPGFTFRPVFTFMNSRCDEVCISSASKEFTLSFFQSGRYEELFDLIKTRIARRVERRPTASKRLRPVSMTIDTLLLNLYTATYRPKRISKEDSIVDDGLRRIKACLFNLAYSSHESWEIRDEIKSRGFSYPQLLDESIELEIPSADYDSTLVTFYKVAKSSSFPGQCFLSYYHILEYHFLRVADDELFHAVRSQLNDPRFKATYESVTKLLAAIKRTDNIGDERELLKSVLLKYVPEDEFIEFVRKLEETASEKLYSDGKQEILGEKFQLRLEEGHALANFSSALKHIRNCLVHSSDRYSREETFLPMTASEDTIVRFIPIVQFMAEKVIFATAE